MESETEKTFSKFNVISFAVWFLDILHIVGQSKICQAKIYYFKEV